MFNQTVPDWLTGVWKRLSIEENGDRDTTTQVTWLQTSSGFADIRIPADRAQYKPIVRYNHSTGNQASNPYSGNPLAFLTPAQALSLSQQEGFAGITQFSGGLCEWQRALDYTPFTGEPDQGTLHWEGDILIEIGPDDAYKEEWQRIATGPTATLTATNSCAWEQWLVICGDYFIYMCDRRPQLPANHSLQDLITFQQDGKLDSRSQQYLDCEVSLGRIQPDPIHSGSSLWEIQQSTMPWKEGCRLWNPEDIGIDPNNNKAIHTAEGSQTIWDIQELGVLQQHFSLQPVVAPQVAIV